MSLDELYDFEREIVQVCFDISLAAALALNINSNLLAEWSLTDLLGICIAQAELNETAYRLIDSFGLTEGSLFALIAPPVTTGDDIPAFVEGMSEFLSLTESELYLMPLSEIILQYCQQFQSVGVLQ
jgi:hypothetical protein